MILSSVSISVLTASWEIFDLKLSKDFQGADMMLHCKEHSQQTDPSDPASCYPYISSATMKRKEFHRVQVIDNLAYVRLLLTFSPLIHNSICRALPLEF